MIIYKRKKKQLVIPCGLGPVVCPEGNYELQMKMVDPSTSLQYVEPDASYYGLYRVIVNPVTSSIDPNLLASNIRRNVTILGVTGSFDGGPLESKGINSSTAQQIVTPDEGYYGLSSVTVEPFTLESKSQNINFNGSYDITPDQADGLSKVTVNVSIGGSTPVMQSKTVDSSTIQQTVTPDSSYDGLSQVTVEPYNLQPSLIAIPSVLSRNTIDASPGYDGLSRVVIEMVDSEIGHADSSTVEQICRPMSSQCFRYVYINPYTVESKSETITQNGQYVFNPSTADALSSVSIDVSVEGGAAVLQSKTVDPSTVQVNVTPDQGYDGLSGVTVNPIDASLDADLIPENIKQGIEIFGVTGTYAGQINNQNKTVDCSTLSQSITFDNGYTGLGTVTVNAAVLQDLSFSPFWRMTSGGQMVFRTDDEEPGIGMNTVTISLPTWEDKTFNPSTNSIVFSPYTADHVHFLRDIVINAVTSSIDPNIQAGNIKSGVTILGVNGTYTGTQGSLMSKTIDSSTSQQTITPDSGYYGLSQVTVNPYTLQDKVLDFNSDEEWDPSIQAAIITPDSSYDGLSSVAVTLESKIVDASTRSQMISATPDSSYFALDTVYIRPVTAAIDSNITPGNIKNGVTILGVTGTYDGMQNTFYSLDNISVHSEESEHIKAYAAYLTDFTPDSSVISYEAKFKAPIVQSDPDEPTEEERSNSYFIFGCCNSNDNRYRFGAWISTDNKLCISFGSYISNSIEYTDSEADFQNGVVVKAWRTGNNYTVELNDDPTTQKTLTIDTLSDFNTLQLFGRYNNPDDRILHAAAGTEISYVRIYGSNGLLADFYPYLVNDNTDVNNFVFMSSTYNGHCNTKTFIKPTIARDGYVDGERNCSVN